MALLFLEFLNAGNHKRSLYHHLKPGVLYACYYDKLGISLSSSQISLGWTILVWSCHMEPDWVTATAHVLATCLVGFFLLLAWRFLPLIWTSYNGDQWKMCAYIKPWRVSDVKMSPKPMTDIQKRQMQRRACDKANWSDVILSQGNSRNVWQYYKLEEARKVPLLELLEQMGHCHTLVSDPGPRLFKNVLLLAQATQFGMLCSDCPTNAAVSTLILIKCLGNVFTSLGTQKGVCFIATPASSSGCYFSSHTMPLAPSSLSLLLFILFMQPLILSHSEWSRHALISIHLKRPPNPTSPSTSSLDLIATKLSFGESCEPTIFQSHSSRSWDYNKLFLYYFLRQFLL